jgi:hypothetical protein
MPSVLCEYELSSEFIKRTQYLRSTVSRYLAKRLKLLGWKRLHCSLWSHANTSIVLANATLSAVAADLEERFPRLVPVGAAGTNFLLRKLCTYSSSQQHTIVLHP